MRMRELLAGCTALLAAALLPSADVGTMAQGMVRFSTGSVLAKVMNEKMGLEARVQPTSGETVLVALINSGEIDFGIANILPLGLLGMNAEFGAASVAGLGMLGLAAWPRRSRARPVAGKKVSALDPQG